MSIQQAIKRIIETLQKIPQNIIPPSHIGVKHPMSEDALPTVVISVKNITESNSGIGNFIGIQKEGADRVSEIKGSKISGIFQIKIWDMSADRIDEITTAIIETITANKTVLRKYGFLNLFLVGEIYPSKLSPDPPKEVVVRLIEYKGVFEFINKEPFDFEEIIKEVHVHIDNVFDEITIVTKPVADFRVSLESESSPLRVTFTDTSTGSPTSWNWDFGDGVTSNEKNLPHTFTKSGIYTVSLTVTYDKGNNSTATKRIEIPYNGIISEGTPSMV